MSGLTWMEEEITGEVAGAINSLAALIRHRPERTVALCAAVIAKLDKHGQLLLSDLDEQVPE